MADGSVKIDITADDSDVKKKLKDTEDGLGGLGKKTEETSKKTDNAKSKYEELTEAISKQTRELTDLKGEYTQAVINFGKNSAEAKELASKISSLNSDLSANKEAFAEAYNAADKMTSALDENEKSFGATDVAIGTLVANGLTSLIGKLSEGVQSLFALAEETREYREDMAKLDTAFTTAGHSTETANAAYKDFYAILGESDRSIEAVNHLAELTKNEKEVAQWSTIAAGVTAKFGDSLPIEGLTEAANETAKVGKVTGPLADALNWAGISEDEFNKKLAACNSEQERASLITSTLNAEYEDAAAKYNELTASTQDARLATANLEEAQADLGAAIEPLTTAWTNLKAGALQWLADVGLPALQRGWQWVKDNLPTIAVLVAGLTGAWLALGGAQTIASGISATLTLIKTGLTALSANPIGLIILAVTALVAAFVYLWNNCEAFRNFFVNMWDNIKAVASTAWEAIKGFFISAWEAIKDAWNACVDFFKNLWEGIKNVFSVVSDWFKEKFSTAWYAIKAVWDTVKGYFEMVWNNIKLIFSAVKSVLSGDFRGAWEAIKGIWGNVTSFFKGIWDSIKNVFSDAKSKFLSIGKNIVAGIKQGIKNAWNNLKEWFKGLFGDLIGIAKKILGIKSPSREFKYIAEMIVAGLAKGLKEYRTLAIKGIQELGTGMIEAMQKTAKEQVAVYTKKLDELEKAQKAGNKSITDEQIKAVEDELKVWEDRDKALETYAKKFEGHLEEFAQIEKDYASDVLKVQNKLQSDIDKEWDNYQKTFENRVSAIKNELGLFDIAEKGDKVKKGDLFKAVESQLDVLDDYNVALDTLMSKNVDPAFIEEMKAMGIDALPALEAINSMTDEELDKYVSLWQDKNVLASDAATDELTGLKAETANNVEALKIQAEKDLTALRTTYRENWIALAAEIGEGMQEATGSGLEELGKQITSFAETGAMMMEGLMEGMESKESQVIDLLVNNITSAIAAAKEAAGIHSPSTVMRDEVGKNLGQGLIEGFHDKMRAIKQAMSEDMQTITASVKATVGLENARYGYNAGVADTGILDLTRAVGMQTAGINSLAGQFNRGSQNMRPVIIELNGRELGRSYVDLGGTETVRYGAKIGGVY